MKLFARQKWSLFKRRGGAPVDFPAPSNASALWDSAYGITLGAPGRVSQWTDRIGGRVLLQATASQRPVYGVDAGGSAARSVVQCAASGLKYIQATGLTPLATAGQRPYIALVCRQRTLVTSGLAISFDVTGSSEFSLRSTYQNSARGDGAGNDYWLMHRNSAGTNVNLTTGDVQNTLVHLWEFVVDAVDGFSVYLDGALLANANYAQAKDAIASAHVNVAIGGVDNSYVSDFTIDVFMEASQTPSTQERAAMLAWARARGGVVP